MEKILSVREFAKRGGLDSKTIRRHVQAGRIKTKTHKVEITGIPESELLKLSKIVKRKVVHITGLT